MWMIRSGPKFIEPDNGAGRVRKRPLDDGNPGYLYRSL
jgi:hypothetical protein